MLPDWFELGVRLPPEHGESVSNFLIERGAPGLQIEEQENFWDITAHFQNAPPIAELLDYWRALGHDPREQDNLRCAVRTIATADWAVDWKRHFRPQAIGQRLYVCPSWDSAPPPGRVALVIDPGMAFGTGQHATTRGCLELLEGYVANMPVARALDVGTGSGLLAIALAKLGVPEVWAIDNDPLARDIAVQNAAVNRVSQQVRIATDIDEAPRPTQIIVANLYANLLVLLAGSFQASLEPGGILVCSGMLFEDTDRVRSTLEHLRFHLRSESLDGGWATLAFQQEP